MHPLFAELFIETDEAELLADEEQRRRERRTTRHRARTAMTHTVRRRDQSRRR